MDKKPFLVFGKEYLHVYKALLDHGVADGGIEKPEGLSLGECVERHITRTLNHRAQREANKKHKEEKRLASLRRQFAIPFDPRRKNPPYTKVFQCRGCSKYFPTTTYKAMYHSIECERACSNELRRLERALGLDDRGKSKRRLRGYGGKVIEPITARALYLRFNGICQLCKRPVEPHLGKGWQPRGWSIGHITPVSYGGDTSPDNVQLECFECNTLKGANTR